MKPIHPRFLLAAAAAIVVAFSPAQLHAHSAVEPAPRTDQGWKDRNALLDKRAAEAGAAAEIVFIGDSITQGWEGDGKEVWAQHYAPRKAVNLGIGGDRTQHVLWRLQNGNLTGLKPKVAVVMIGTNNSNGEDNTVAEIAEGVAAIVKQLRTSLPGTKVLLVGIFPRSENPTPQRGKVLMVNQVIRNLADDQNVFWADFGNRFVGADGRIPRALMPDYLHLSRAGYEIWASSIAGQLNTLLGTPAAAASTGTGAATANLTGDWTWTIRDQNGNPVEAPLTLKQDGAKVTGRFARGDNRWLEIENGSIQGSDFTWTVKRDRADGSILTYKMTGRVDGNQITGTTSTTLDGNEVTTDWSAKRK